MGKLRKKQPYEDVGESNFCEEAWAEDGAAEEEFVELEPEQPVEAQPEEVAVEIPRTSPQQMSRFFRVVCGNPSQLELANV
eukprot:1943048-Amphidinium_carterae.1